MLLHCMLSLAGIGCNTETKLESTVFLLTMENKYIVKNTQQQQHYNEAGYNKI